MDEAELVRIFTRYYHRSEGGWSEKYDGNMRNRNHWGHTYRKITFVENVYLFVGHEITNLTQVAGLNDSNFINSHFLISTLASY